MREKEQCVFVGKEYLGKRKQAHKPEPGVSSVGEQQSYPPSSDAGLVEWGMEERCRKLEDWAHGVSQPLTRLVRTWLSKMRVLSRAMVTQGPPWLLGREWKLVAHQKKGTKTTWRFAEN